MMALLAIAAYLGLACFWVLPSIMAFRRHHPNRWVILAINVVLGPPGWVIALIWVLFAVLHPTPVSSAAGGGPGLNITFGKASGPGGGPFGTGAGAKPAGSQSAAAIAADLERLSSLKAGGYIDEAEFATLKAEILARV